MSFIKRVAEAIVRSGGHNLPVDMKSLGNVSSTGKFQSLLQGINRQSQMAVPAPPTPPADPLDLAAQQQYNQDLLAYNQAFQQYHTQVLSMFNQRFLMMQQAMIQAQRSQSGSSDTSVSRYDTSSIGSIIGTDLDL